MTMPESKKRLRYNIYQCTDCDKEFIARQQEGRGWKPSPYCPYCGDDEYVDRIREYLLTKPLLYRGRPYTQEEDDIIVISHQRKLTHKETAAELEGRTWASVRNRKRKLKEEGVIE